MLSLAFRASDRLFRALQAAPPPSNPTPRAAAKLDALRRRKADVQARLHRLLEPHSSVCVECAGRCCGEEASVYLGPFDDARAGKASCARPCCHLGPRGCTLDARQRPARCVAYVCPELVPSMSLRTEVQVLAEVVRLLAVSSAIAAVLSRRGPPRGARRA